MALNQLVECIPNISEGRNQHVIQKIVEVIKNSAGIQLLHVDSGRAVNRSVFTFIGSASAVIECAYQMYKYTAQYLDMREHKGVHPRLGMVDVCPFVPVKNILIPELNHLVWKLGKRVGYDFGIPVYFYEYSSLSFYRKNLETIRKGEYELLSERFNTGKSIPDIGPVKFNAKTGATVMGVRNFLIAFNIELANTTVDIAKKIASRMRVIRNNHQLSAEYLQKIALKVKNKYNLQHFKVIGWELKDIKKVQISLNLTNHAVTPVFLVYELTKHVSKEFNAEVSDSELIGLIPKSAITEIADYLALEHSDEHHLVETTFRYLNIRGDYETRILDDVL